MNCKTLCDVFSASQPGHKLHYLILFIAGALLTLAFEPFNIIPLALLSFCVLLYSWRQASPKQTFWGGWFFSMGLQSTGVSWIFFSLHYHGNSPAPLAVLIILLLAAYLSLYPALAGWVVNRFIKQPAAIKLIVLYPLSWGLFEWLQGWVMTGFAWMQPGYVLIDTPLAGFAPVLGNHALGVLLLMLSGSMVAMLFGHVKQWAPVALFFGLLFVGYALKHVEWTTPMDKTIKVSLIQGNVPQAIKWKREMHVPTLERYRDLTLQQTDADLIIWPETAIPGYQHRLTAYIARLDKQMREQNASLLMGIFIKNPQTGRYYNSLLNSNGQAYKKRHLVPLGEYIPLRFLIEFFNRWINIPMSDIAHGDKQQPLLTGAGQPLGVSICFEDAFSRDVRRDLPEATMLVNVSNDAWFDGSHETWQHHAIARMRALETGRPMLRVTNTGITSIINADGSVKAIAPKAEMAVLKGEITPRTGATPYVKWGDVLFVTLVLIVLLIAWRFSRGR